MWDFSWMERRWSGAGYECWDTALDELVERGYDTLRIDAYPHLLAEDPEKEWELLPVWNAHDWGCPAPLAVKVGTALVEFIGKCRDRDIRVGLSAYGVEAAVETGRWSMLCTSNFCGPQFVGMWRDVEWHQRLTRIIKNAAC